MTYRVDIQPAEINFQVSSDHTVLDAALASQFFLEHSCKKGECGSCSAELLSGIVKNKQGEIISTGRVLTCCSYAQSDLCLVTNYYPELSGIQCLSLPCKVADYIVVADNIVILTLRFPPKVTLNYLPGQYIDLTYQGVKRSFSIANAKTDPMSIELHIRLLPNGEFTQLLRSEHCLNQLMRIDGPKGTFFVRKNDAPIIFLAGGTGFAPIKAMVEALVADNSQREIYIYWGMSNSKDFYTKIAQFWESERSTIHFVPVVSEQDDNWHGRTGFVHKAVLDDFSSLKDYHVYACGSPLMIDAAKEAFFAEGLASEHFYADAFVVSK